MEINSDEDARLPERLCSRALGNLPVFPLPQAVLFPRALLPLHIFEPRYRAMLAHCARRPTGRWSSRASPTRATRSTPKGAPASRKWPASA